ncbi:MAG: hypothetical protein GEU97_24960 [Actinophytocola sp.]|nr:hypothetical protein [Actinophytocola sp.]
MERFRIGQRFTSASRSVTREDLATFARWEGLRVSDGVAPAAFGVILAAELDRSEDQGGPPYRVLESSWSYHRPIRVGDALRLEVTITGCDSADNGERVIHRHLALVTDGGEQVQAGTDRIAVSAGHSGAPDPRSVIGSLDWAAALAELLSRDARFRSATDQWDGTIGLRCGDREMQLRIYRGRVIETARRTPLGATFTVAASELTWTELLTGPRNDFMRLAMRGRFSVIGNGYEYLRLAKVLSVLVDNARLLTEEGEYR